MVRYKSQEKYSPMLIQQRR